MGQIVDEAVWGFGRKANLLLSSSISVSKSFESAWSWPQRTQVAEISVNTWPAPCRAEVIAGHPRMNTFAGQAKTSPFSRTSITRGPEGRRIMENEVLARPDAMIWTVLLLTT